MMHPRIFLYPVKLVVMFVLAKIYALNALLVTYLVMVIVITKMGMKYQLLHVNFMYIHRMR